MEYWNSVCIEKIEGVLQLPVDSLSKTFVDIVNTHFLHVFWYFVHMH